MALQPAWALPRGGQWSAERNPLHNELNGFLACSKHDLNATRRLVLAAHGIDFREILQDEWYFLEDHMHRVERLRQDTGIAGNESTCRGILAIARGTGLRIRSTAETGKRHAKIVAGARLIIDCINACGIISCRLRELGVSLHEAWLSL